MHALGLSDADPARARLVRRDRRGGRRAHGGRARRRRGRDAFAALRARSAGARARGGDSLLAAAARRGRARARGGGLQRRGDAVRRHRDDRGHDRQRGAAPAREPGRARAGARRPGAPGRRDRGVAAARARRGGRSTATRRATSTLGGASIRRGDLVRVSIAAANRDPAVFPDPDRFDVAPRQRAAATSPSRTARTSASGCTSRGWRRTPRCAAARALPALRLDPEAAAPRGLVFRKPPELRVVFEDAHP